MSHFQSGQSLFTGNHVPCSFRRSPVFFVSSRLDNYWMISLYFSAIAFAGSWYLVKKINDSFEGVQPATILGFLFFPSVVFWSAGIIKESVAMAALFFPLHYFFENMAKRKTTLDRMVFTLTSLWIEWNLKYYYLAIFLPIAFTTFTFQYLLTKFTLKNLALKVMLWCLIFIIPLLLMSLLHPNFYYERFIEVVVSSYYEFQAISNPEDLIHYDALKATSFEYFAKFTLGIIFRLIPSFHHGSAHCITMVYRN